MDLFTALALFGDLLSVLVAPLLVAMAVIALASPNFREEEGNAFSLLVYACALLGVAEIFIAAYNLTAFQPISLLATVFRLSATVLILQIIRVKLRAGFRERKKSEAAGKR
jgi:hypothetical protein